MTRRLARLHDLPHLRFPLDDLEALRELRAGQRLWVDGTIFGIRDATHIAMFDRGELPQRADLRGAAIVHTAPNVRTREDGSFEKLCIGTTTSARMSRFTRQVMECGVRAIIGKAGLFDDQLPVLREFGGVYLALVGGSAALTTREIEDIVDVEFPELLPECLWTFRVREFGPLFVAMDSHGTSLFHDVQDEAQRRLDGMAEALRLKPTPGPASTGDSLPRERTDPA
jgi:L(+)-tartrate dehydratase beta subunit